MHISEQAQENTTEPKHSKGTLRRINLLKKKAHQAFKEGRIEDVLIPVSDLLNIDMDDPNGLFLAGAFFREKGHSAIAAQLFRRCVSLQPRKVNAWLFFGACLHDIHEYDAAKQCYMAAKSLSPRDAGVYGNLAASCVQSGEFADALNYANESLKIAPDHKTARSCRAMASLAMGRWKEGFEDYKAMYGGQLVIRIYRQPEEPEWDGSKGKTVVVQCDQGLGDELMYSSILPDMVKDCKKIILDCHPKLEAVFKRSFPEIDVYGTKKLRLGVEWVDRYEIDAHYHISGIGKFYRRKDKDFPRKAYLIPDEALRQKWREKLSQYPKPWVGLTWQGGIIQTQREYRSIEPEDWKPVLNIGGSFIDLSYHDSHDEIGDLPIIRMEQDQNNYDDTLALIAELDIVVSVQTAVVHACGAIGKKALVLVPNRPAWRYGWKRQDMIWYPRDSVKLFRQEKEETSFVPVIQRIAEEYANYYKDFHRVRSEGSDSVSCMREQHTDEHKASSRNRPAVSEAY